MSAPGAAVIHAGSMLNPSCIYAGPEIGLYARRTSTKLVRWPFPPRGGHQPAARSGMVAVKLIETRYFYQHRFGCQSKFGGEKEELKLRSRIKKSGNREGRWEAVEANRPEPAKQRSAGFRPGGLELAVGFAPGRKRGQSSLLTLAGAGGGASEFRLPIAGCQLSESRGGGRRSGVHRT